MASPCKEREAELDLGSQLSGPSLSDTQSSVKEPKRKLAQLASVQRRLWFVHRSPLPLLSSISLEPRLVSVACNAKTCITERGQSNSTAVSVLSVLAANAIVKSGGNGCCCHNQVLLSHFCSLSFSRFLVLSLPYAPLLRVLLCFHSPLVILTPL